MGVGAYLQKGAYLKKNGIRKLNPSEFYCSLLAFPNYQF